MDESDRNPAVAADARRYGLRVAERIVAPYPARVEDAQGQEIVAQITRQILKQVHEMWKTGLPPRLTIVWGNECVNGVIDRLLEHMEFLRVCAALVAFDPSSAAKEGGDPAAR